MENDSLSPNILKLVPELGVKVWTPPFFYRGEWISINSLGGRGTWKIKKGGESMVQWQLFLKAGAGTFAVKFFKGWTFLHLEIILLCKTALYIWRKNIFRIFFVIFFIQIFYSHIIRFVIVPFSWIRTVLIILSRISKC